MKEKSHHKMHCVMQRVYEEVRLLMTGMVKSLSVLPFWWGSAFKRIHLLEAATFSP
jgi:hypothetical protein